MAKNSLITQDGSYDKIIKHMKKTPTKLFNYKAIMLVVKKDEKAAKAALNYLFFRERIFRHKDNDADGNMLYAISINEQNRHIKRALRIGQKSPADEIRSLFSQVTGNLLELEEKVIQLVQSLKDDSKEVTELRRLATKLKKLDI